MHLSLQILSLLLKVQSSQPDISELTTTYKTRFESGGVLKEMELEQGEGETQGGKERRSEKDEEWTERSATCLKKKETKRMHADSLKSGSHLISDAFKNNQPRRKDIFSKSCTEKSILEKKTKKRCLYGLYYRLINTIFLGKLK